MSTPVSSADPACRARRRRSRSARESGLSVGPSSRQRSWVDHSAGLDDGVRLANGLVDRPRRPTSRPGSSMTTPGRIPAIARLSPVIEPRRRRSASARRSVRLSRGTTRVSPPRSRARPGRRRKMTCHDSYGSPVSAVERPVLSPASALRTSSMRHGTTLSAQAGTVARGWRPRTSSTNAASRSAIGRVADLEHVLRVPLSPEREKLKLPTNAMSSATTTFACMKSCSDVGDHGVDGLPLNGAPSRDALQERDLPSRSRRSSATGRRPGRPACRRRRRRRRSGSSFTTSTSVREDRPGREHRRGDADRARCALPMCFATRCESASPCSGQNQARTCAVADVDRPRIDVAGAARRRRVSQSWPKSAARTRRRSPASPTVDDDVLLARPRVVGPVRRAGPDRSLVADDELVVHQVGDARDRRASRPGSASIALGRVSGRRRHRDRAGVGDVVERGAPRRRAAPRRAAQASTSAPASVSKRTS